MCRWVGGQGWVEGREVGLVVVERQARLQAGAGRTVQPAVNTPRLPLHHCSAAGCALAAGAGAGRGHPVWLHRHRLAGGWGDAGVGGRCRRQRGKLVAVCLLALCCWTRLLSPCVMSTSRGMFLLGQPTDGWGNQPDVFPASRP